MGDAAMKRRINEILARIHAVAAKRRGPARAVKLVAVTKKFPPEVIEAAWRHGLHVFGENYVQEAVAKIEALNARGYEFEWHFIGHLQKNKAKRAVEYFDWIETVDSMDLLNRLIRLATVMKKEINTLVQVNISGDPGKAGLLPQDCLPFFREVADKDLGPLRVRGLMTITRFHEDPEEARQWFRGLRELRDRLVDSLRNAMPLEHLSMGMSNDFEVAIEEGATIVRVGQALFGPRPRLSKYEVNRDV